jgi:hypothetical protein
MVKRMRIEAMLNSDQSMGLRIIAESPSDGVFLALFAKRGIHCASATSRGDDPNGGVSELVILESQAWTEANRAAKELGRRGGLKGGRARAEALTKEQRSEAGRKAVEARWEKHRKNEAELGRAK